MHCIYKLNLYTFLNIGFHVLLFFFLGICVWILSGLGVTAGLHRLWSHKSYKAKWPLRLILMLMSTIAFEVIILLILSNVQNCSKL